MRVLPPQDLAAWLQKAGFRVLTALDVGSEVLRASVAQFEARVVPGCLALVAFVGHGGMWEGRRYMLPLDFRWGGAACVCLCLCNSCCVRGLGCWGGGGGRWCVSQLFVLNLVLRLLFRIGWSWGWAVGQVGGRSINAAVHEWRATQQAAHVSVSTTTHTHLYMHNYTHTVSQAAQRAAGRTDRGPPHTTHSG